MRAARVHTFRKPLRVDTVPDPEPAADERAVRLTHAGINPLDLRLRDGHAGRVTLPFTPGMDGVGHADGAPVAVYGGGLGLRRPGTYADYVVVPQQSLVPIPSGVDLTMAAALGVAGATAWGLVSDTAQVTATDRLLVLGASGGVGSLVIQLAKAVNATVLAHTTEPAGAEFLRELGADEVLVAGADDLAARAKPLSPTVVIDGLGGTFTGAAMHAVEPGGRLVVFGTAAGSSGPVDFGALYRKALTITGHAALTVSPAQARSALTGCLELLAGKLLRPHIDAVLPLADVNEAHDRIAGRRVSGKLLLGMA